MRVTYKVSFIFCLITCLLLAGLLSACKHKRRDDNTIYMGTIAGPETDIMRTAAQVAEQDGLTIKIVEFQDYNTPNAALAEGSIDANVFQHQAYLDLAIKNRGYKVESIGKTFVYPMAIYSTRVKTLHDLPDGAKIAIPNDPSNGARALRLLVKAQLVGIDQLSSLNDMELSPKKITHNPHHFIIKELDAAQLPRVLKEVDAAVINTNYALPAGLKPKDALVMEDANSPYANIIVIRSNDKTLEKYQKLIKVLHSQAVLDKAKALFDDQAIPAWKK